MPVSIEEQIAEMLRRSATKQLSLQQLHGLLVREIGGAAGSYHDLLSRLKRVSPRFLVLDRPDPLRNNTGWSWEVREAYVSALDHAGIDLSPLVSFAPAQVAAEDDPADVIAVLRSTLVRLTPQLAQDPAISEDIVAALSGITNLSVPAMPTTILPRDPPAAP